MNESILVKKNVKSQVVHTSSISLMVVVVVFNSHNDVPPAPQRYVSVAAVQSPERPSISLRFMVMQFLNCLSYTNIPAYQI